MTTDQVRIQISVTVTMGDGRRGRRTSVIEVVRPATWDALQNPRTWVQTEATHAYTAAWAEAAKELPR
jgi:hypothetical protein